MEFKNRHKRGLRMTEKNISNAANGMNTVPKKVFVFMFFSFISPLTFFTPFTLITGGFTQDEALKFMLNPIYITLYIVSLVSPFILYSANIYLDIYINFIFY